MNCIICGKPVETGEGGQAVGILPALHTKCVRGLNEGLPNDLPQDLSKEELGELTSYHVDHYKRLIGKGLRGDRNVRVGECKMYLTIWESIAKKGQSLFPDDYSPTELGEIHDAWADRKDEADYRALQVVPDHDEE